MKFKETIEEVQALVDKISIDLKKVNRGNKEAAQRVRVNTVKLEKVGKVFRKESLKIMPR